MCRLSEIFRLLETPESDSIGDAGALTQSLFSEGRTVGTGGLVPHRGPSRSPNVHRKPPSNKASHRRVKGRCGQLRSSQAGQGRSSGSREEDPSEPLPAQSLGPPGLSWSPLCLGNAAPAAARGHTCGPWSHLRQDARPPTATRQASGPPQPSASPGDTPTTQTPDASQPAAQAALLARPFSPLTWNPIPGSAGLVILTRASA